MNRAHNCPPRFPHWAFVVQVRQGSGFSPDTQQGRVEHIVSGQATTFTSLAELVAFIKQTVATEEKTTNEGHQP